MFPGAQKAPKDKSFEIKSIDWVSNGKSSEGSRSITLNSDGTYSAGSSGLVYGGEIVPGAVGKFGVTSNIYTTFPKEDVDKMKGLDREGVIGAAMQSKFKVNADLFVPFAGLSAPGEAVGKAYENKFKNVLEEKLKTTFVLDAERQASSETQNRIKEIAGTIMEKIKQNNIPLNGMYHIEIENNPAYIAGSKDSSTFPKINLFIPGKTNPVVIGLSADGAQFVRDSLEAGIRAPDKSKDEIKDFSAYGVSSSILSLFSKERVRSMYVGGSIERLWFQNFGKGNDKWDRMLYLPDKDYFLDPNTGYLNWYMNRTNRR